jgi:hypothetical protein
LPRGIAFTLADRDHGCIAIRVDIDTVDTGLLNRECHVRRIDLIDFAAKQTPNVEIKGALV